MYRKNPKTSLKIILLKTCPFSQALAQLVRKHPRVHKKWITRTSKNFEFYKARYNAQTFPIVVFVRGDEEMYVGGYTDVKNLLRT